MFRTITSGVIVLLLNRTNTTSFLLKFIWLIFFLCSTCIPETDDVLFGTDNTLHSYTCMLKIGSLLCHSDNIFAAIPVLWTSLLEVALDVTSPTLSVSLDTTSAGAAFCKAISAVNFSLPSNSCWHYFSLSP